VGILGYGEIISNCADTLQPAELAEMGRNFLESGQRLQRLVQNFLIYSQLELLRADDHEVQAMRTKRVEDVYETLVLVARTKAQAVGRLNDLQADIGHAAAAIADDLLAKIVEELLANAFKFSKPGTPVVLTAIPEGKILKFEITDRGRGMKIEHLSNIDAYVQFDRRRHEQQGTGLGLVIAKRLTEMHGGTLNLDSTEGVGTTVTVRLPLAAS